MALWAWPVCSDSSVLVIIVMHLMITLMVIVTIDNIMFI